MKEVLKIHGGIVFQMLKLSDLYRLSFLVFSVLSKHGVLNKISITWLFVFLFLTCFIKTAGAQSAQFVFIEEKKPKTIFLFPGQVSLLTLPCQITKALVGSPNDIKVEIDKINKKELHILLKKWRPEASNLILKCKDKVFLFSLIPSKNNHYDYVKVLGHVLSKPLKVKSTLPNSPSPFVEGLSDKDFKIQKILDFSWEDSK